MLKVIKKYWVIAILVVLLGILYTSKKTIIIRASRASSNDGWYNFYVQDNEFNSGGWNLVGLNGYIVAYSGTHQQEGCLHDGDSYEVARITHTIKAGKLGKEGFWNEVRFSQTFAMGALIEEPSLVVIYGKPKNTAANQFLDTEETWEAETLLLSLTVEKTVLICADKN